MRNHLYSWFHQLNIICPLNSCWPFCCTLLIFSSWWRCLRTTLGSLGLASACLALGGNKGNWCVLSASWSPKSLHALQCLPRVHLVLSNHFVSSGTVQDFGLIFCTLWHPDWLPRPMGSPPALKGGNYKSKSKWSCLVEVFRQSNICVRMD